MRPSFAVSAVEVDLDGTEFDVAVVTVELDVARSKHVDVVSVPALDLDGASVPAPRRQGFPSCGLRQQLGQTDQIARASRQRDHPAEWLLDALARTLADRAARVARDAAVDGRAPPRRMLCDADRAQPGNMRWSQQTGQVLKLGSPTPRSASYWLNGIFSEGVRSMSVERRRARIEPEHPRLSIARQCALVSIGR